MNDFTRNIKLRALSVGDFVEMPSEKEDKDWDEMKYTLSNEFECEGDLKAGVVDGTFWLEYRLEDCNIFGWEADTFEEVVEAFNDWRMKMYSDLLFLPDNQTIKIKMTGYFLERNKYEKEISNQILESRKGTCNANPRTRGTVRKKR